jgi:Trk K+ transport system NAD-binding subunit
MPIGEGSELDGRPLREANLPGEARVLALGRRGRPRFDWDLQDGYLLIPGDRLVVLATRSGIGHIRARTIGAPTPGSASPAR